MVAYSEGDYEPAIGPSREGLLILRQVGQHIVHNSLATFAGLAVRLGQAAAGSASGGRDCGPTAT